MQGAGTDGALDQPIVIFELHFGLTCVPYSSRYIELMRFGRLDVALPLTPPRGIIPDMMESIEWTP